MKSRPRASGQGMHKQSSPRSILTRIPRPKGLPSRKSAPAGAYFDQKLGEFVLPYEVVRTSRDPEATLMAFLESTYRAAADLGQWDRSALECPTGEPLRPRPLGR